MSISNRGKVEVTLPAEETDLSAEEIVPHTNIATADAIKKRLNDKAFLGFLQKNPEAVDNSTDDEYLLQKIEVFENIQRVKQQVKEFITKEAGANFTGVVDDSFMDSMEAVAIKDPVVFLEFSTNISQYLETAKKSKGLEITYQKMATIFKIEGDLDRLSDSAKIGFINEVHARLAVESTAVQHDKKKLEDSHSGLYWFLRSKKKIADDFKPFDDRIQALKVLEGNLDQAAITGFIEEAERIKGELKGNMALEVVRVEFIKKAQARIAEAIKSENNSDLIKDQAVFGGLRERASILDDDKFDDFAKNIDQYSKEQLFYSTEEMVDTKEVTLSTFEKGIQTMRKKGMDLGLNIAECNGQIVATLKDKIKELKAKPNDGQNKIKLILAKRILTNLE
jgi:hypothetical protein